MSGADGHGRKPGLTLVIAIAMLSVPYAHMTPSWHDDYPELGDGLERMLTDTGMEVIDVSVGGEHACAIVSLPGGNSHNGSVYCWGQNYHGQLGNGFDHTNSPTAPESHYPVLVEIFHPNHGAPMDASEISLGDRHSCALAGNLNYMFCWGYNGHGQLGDGTTEDSSLPVYIDAYIDEVSAGKDHTCAIQEGYGAKLAACWGKGSDGRRNGEASHLGYERRRSQQKFPRCETSRSAGFWVSKIIS